MWATSASGGRASRTELLEVLGEAAASAEPGEGALDHPAARQDLEALGGSDRLMISRVQLADAAQRVPELVAGIAAIGEDMAQPGEALADRLQHIDGAVAVLDVGGVDDERDQQAAVSVRMWRLRPLIFLPAS